MPHPVQVPEILVFSAKRWGSFMYSDIFLLADQPGAMILFAVLFGLGLGGEYMIIPLVVAELFGVKVLGRMMGIILTADGVAEAVTPMVVAKLRDATGSYDAGFMLLIGLSFLGLIVISFLPRKRREDPAPV
jgi:MFS-type transporter involved in bile tolerance (Atg22 family)